MAKSYTKLPGFCFSNTYCAISALFTLPLTFGIWYSFYYMSQPGQLHLEAAPQFMFARIGLALLIWLVVALAMQAQKLPKLRQRLIFLGGCLFIGACCSLFGLVTPVPRPLLPLFQMLPLSVEWRVELAPWGWLYCWIVMLALAFGYRDGVLRRGAKIFGAVCYGLFAATLLGSCIAASVAEKRAAELDAVIGKFNVSPAYRRELHQEKPTAGTEELFRAAFDRSQQPAIPAELLALELGQSSRMPSAMADFLVESAGLRQAVETVLSGSELRFPHADSEFLGGVNIPEQQLFRHWMRVYRLHLLVAVDQGDRDEARRCLIWMTRLLEWARMERYNNGRIALLNRCGLREIYLKTLRDALESGILADADLQVPAAFLEQEYRDRHDAFRRMTAAEAANAIDFLDGLRQGRGDRNIFLRKFSLDRANRLMTAVLRWWFAAGRELLLREYLQELERESYDAAVPLTESDGKSPARPRYGLIAQVLPPPDSALRAGVTRSYAALPPAIAAIRAELYRRKNGEFPETPELLPDPSGSKPYRCSVSPDGRTLTIESANAVRTDGTPVGFYFTAPQGK